MLLATFATTGVRVEYSADDGQPFDWFLMRVLSAIAELEKELTVEIHG
jgi:hypothetical protein